MPVQQSWINLCFGELTFITLIVEWTLPPMSVSVSVEPRWLMALSEPELKSWVRHYISDFSVSFRSIIKSFIKTCTWSRGISDWSILTNYWHAQLPPTSNSTLFTLWINYQCSGAVCVRVAERKEGQPQHEMKQRVWIILSLWMRTILME